MKRLDSDVMHIYINIFTQQKEQQKNAERKNTSHNLSR